MIQKGCLKTTFWKVWLQAIFGYSNAQNQDEKAVPTGTTKLHLGKTPSFIWKS